MEYDQSLEAINWGIPHEGWDLCETPTPRPMVRFVPKRNCPTRCVPLLSMRMPRHDLRKTSSLLIAMFQSASLRFYVMRRYFRASFMLTFA
jgi:hypothetical protein